MSTPQELETLSSKLKLIDVNLADPDDENLVTVIHAAAELCCNGLLDGITLLGIICRAYSAGRTRGRKEGFMREILEGSENSECG